MQARPNPMSMILFDSLHIGPNPLHLCHSIPLGLYFSLYGGYTNGTLGFIGIGFGGGGYANMNPKEEITFEELVPTSVLLHKCHNQTELYAAKVLALTTSKRHKG